MTLELTSNPAGRSRTQAVTVLERTSHAMHVEQIWHPDLGVVSKNREFNALQILRACSAQAGWFEKLGARDLNSLRHGPER